MNKGFQILAVEFSVQPNLKGGKIIRTKLIACLGIVSLLVLFVGFLPLYSVDCDIGIHVQDGEGNPKVNTPVKLIALSYGDADTVLFTGGDGIALFWMNDWPNSCPDPPCESCDYNKGNYRAHALFWCTSDDFYYNGTHKHVDLVVSDPCR